MRVKNDHPNTTEHPQQIQQRPVNQVSEELESRFKNALKPTQAESEHESETSRLFAAVLNADKLDSMKHKGKASSAIPEAGKELLDAGQEHPENLKDQPANEKSDAGLHPGKPSHALSERETVQSVQQDQLHKLDAAAHKLNPTAKDAATIVDSKIIDLKAALSALEEKVKAVKHIDLRHPSSESDAKLHPMPNLSQATAQGDIILKNVETHGPQNRAQDVSELINKLVNKIYVSLPSANEREVRLLLNEGQLKGGEISIKQDSSGYSVLIKQEHALSLINQTAKQELTERLQRLGIDQPIRIAVSEQMNQQQDQKRSRQQRSIYDEWKPEDK
tara:strand:+ start:934 stop:1932 length:999 start_codon:yes stop_codon:yes gene_type:complete